MFELHTIIVLEIGFTELQVHDACNDNFQIGCIGSTTVVRVNVYVDTYKNVHVILIGTSTQRIYKNQPPDCCLECIENIIHSTFVIRLYDECECKNIYICMYVCVRFC